MYNTFQPLHESTLHLIERLESAAMVMLYNDMEIIEVIDNLTDTHGDVLPYNVIRMIVGSAYLLYNE
jgi:hypothetical protein